MNLSKDGRMKLCHKCGEEWISQHRIPGRTETCSRCGYDLRCCLNCSLYDATAPQQCKSPTVELVQDKEKGNFCDEFDFAEGRGPQKAEPKQDQSRDAWKKLFGS